MIRISREPWVGNVFLESDMAFNPNFKDNVILKIPLLLILEVLKMRTEDMRYWGCEYIFIHNV